MKIALLPGRGAPLYYDLAIVRTSGRRTNAGSGIRDKREAEWLAQLIEDAVGTFTTVAQHVLCALRASVVN